MSVLKESLELLASLGVEPKKFDPKGFLPFEVVDSLLTPSWESLGGTFMDDVTDSILGLNEKTLDAILGAVATSSPIAAVVVTATKAILEYAKKIKENTKVVSVIRRSQGIQRLVDQVTVADMYGRFALPRFTYITPKKDCRRRLVLPAQTVAAPWETASWPGNYKPTGNVRDGLDVTCGGGDGDTPRPGAKGSRPWGYISVSALTYPLCIGTRGPLVLPGIPPGIAYELYSGGKFYGENLTTSLINPNAKLIALQASASMDPFTNAKVNIGRVVSARKQLLKYSFTGFTAKEGEGQTFSVSRSEIAAAVSACDAVLQCRASLLNSRAALVNLTKASPAEQKKYSLNVKKVLEQEKIVPESSLGNSGDRKTVKIDYDAVAEATTKQTSSSAGAVALVGLGLAAFAYASTRKK